MKNNKGFTLVELIVVMAIFVGVIIMTSSAFDSILRGTSQHMKSAESQIEGIVGLEMLRYDIEHAGFGLPWSFQNISSTYTEGSSVGVSGIDYTKIVDSPPRAPRAVVGLAGPSGSNYLVIKSTVAALNSAVKRWGYVNYSALGATNYSYLKPWVHDPNNFTVQPGDKVITLSSSFASLTGQLDKQLVMHNGSYYTSVATDAATSNLILQNVAFNPVEPTQTYMVYTVSSGSTLSMPYNRADYYIKRPSDANQIPASCNPGTGIFYKSTLNQGSGGGLTTYPLLDCVGDMQVILYLDMNDDGTAGTYALVDGSSVTSVEGADATSVASTLADPSLLRSRLKQVQVYLLAHEGKKDSSFKYMRDSIIVGDQGLGRTWTPSTMGATFGSDWRNYRWKVYSVMVRPKNIN